MAEEKQLTILYHSDFCGAKSGFGRHAKSLLTYLYKTGKYRIVSYVAGINWSNAILNVTPWKTIGCLPDNPQEMESINRDPKLARDTAYGAYYIDRVIAQEKPDVWIGVQDAWAFSEYYKRPWFNKINCVMNITADSEPILPEILQQAKVCKHYSVWSKFAERALHKAGHTHVTTIPGCVEKNDFYSLSKMEKQALRQRFGIKDDTFVFGFVFRNQLRKLVPNFLDGFQLFKKNNPTADVKLLFHTCFSEGWPIPQLATERGINPDDILTTYICHACHHYDVRPFNGEGTKCRFCNQEKAQHTTNVAKGVSERQLNDVYNLMDGYVHPATSGALELPLIEAQLAGLVCLTSPYSFGEDILESPASLPLKYSVYYEFGTTFKKSSTCPVSIAEQMEKLLKMPKETLEELGKKGRQWAIDNYSVEAIGKKWETLLDSLQPTTYDFDFKEKPKNPLAEVPEQPDDSLWLINLYNLILNMKVDGNDDGHRYWMEQIKKGMKRDQIEQYFRGVADKENREKHNRVSLSDILDKNGRKRYLLVIKESIGDCFLVTALFKSIKEQYPDYDIYVASDPTYHEMFAGNPHIHKWIPYDPAMESEIFMTGRGEDMGFFEAYCNVALSTQKILNYVSRTELGLDIRS